MNSQTKGRWRVKSTKCPQEGPGAPVQRGFLPCRHHPRSLEPDGAVVGAQAEAWAVGRAGRGRGIAPSESRCRIIVTKRKPQKPTGSVQGNRKEDKIHQSLGRKGRLRRGPVMAAFLACELHGLSGPHKPALSQQSTQTAVGPVAQPNTRKPTRPPTPQGSLG